MRINWWLVDSPHKVSVMGTFVILNKILNKQWCSLQWRHNERDGVSNHRRLDGLLNSMVCSASLACVRGIHRSPVNSPHKGPVTQKMLPFDDVIMWIAVVPIWRPCNDINWLVSCTAKRIQTRSVPVNRTSPTMREDVTYLFRQLRTFSKLNFP